MLNNSLYTFFINWKNLTKRSCSFDGNIFLISSILILTVSKINLDRYDSKVSNLCINISSLYLSKKIDFPIRQRAPDGGHPSAENVYSPMAPTCNIVILTLIFLEVGVCSVPGLLFPFWPFVWSLFVIIVFNCSLLKHMIKFLENLVVYLLTIKLNTFR